jgi:hypothetical protein
MGEHARRIMSWLPLATRSAQRIEPALVRPSDAADTVIPDSLTGRRRRDAFSARRLFHPAREANVPPVWTLSLGPDARTHLRACACAPDATTGCSVGDPIERVHSPP